MQAAARLTQKVLSYDWKTLDADIKANQAVLAPSFRSEYAKTMAGVKDQTIKNQVKLTADAAATSIVSATENEGRRAGVRQPGDHREGHRQPAGRQQPGVGHADAR